MFVAVSSASGSSYLQIWQDSGETIIVVRASSLSHLQRIEAECSRYGIPTFSCADAGRTEVSEGSVTVLACGPSNSDVVHRVTAGLKSY